MAGIRSKAYPSISLGAAVGRAETIRRNVGKGFFDREMMAKNMGYKSLSGVATRAIAALVHYGLLERKKDKYSLSDLAMRIVMPVNTTDKQDAILDALREPELYRELIAAYPSSEEVPSALGNVLAHSYGINPNTSADAARVFIESLEYAGVYENKHITMPDVTASEDELSDDNQNQAYIRSVGSNTSSKGIEERAQSTHIRKLPSGVQIGFPRELDYALMTGEFAEAIKDLENIAQRFLIREDHDGGESGKL